MFRKIFMRALTGAALSLGLTAAAHAIELRYAHVGAEGDIQTIFAEQAAKGIEKATNGEVKIKVYPASQLGGVSEMVDGVRMGSISMGHHDFASLARIVPEVAVFNAPFIFRDADQALAATDPATSPVLQEINKKLIEKGGVRIIGRIYRGAREISANFPVKSPADLKGKPFRAVPLDLWVSMVKGFGAVPTPVEVSELPTALMTGLVVGQENPLTMIYANKLYEVQKSVSLTDHMQSVLAVFINEEVWQSLTDEQRKTISRVLDEEAHKSLKMAEDSKADLITKLKDKGMTIVTKDNGLDIDAFMTSVLKQIKADFPDYGQYYDRISAIK